MKSFCLLVLTVLFITIGALQSSWAADAFGTPAIIRMLQEQDQKLQALDQKITVILNQISVGVKNSARRYYLTRREFLGDQPLTACAEGFHMASFFEILDPSNLAYDTSYGVTRADAGQGPPVLLDGWLRTGFRNSGGNEAPGFTNCATWTTGSEAVLGSVAHLKQGAAGGDALIPVVNYWVPDSWPCNKSFPVWCVEDQ